MDSAASPRRTYGYLFDADSVIDNDTYTDAYTYIDRHRMYPLRNHKDTLS